MSFCVHEGVEYASPQSSQLGHTGQAITTQFHAISHIGEGIFIPCLYPAPHIAIHNQFVVVGERYSLNFEFFHHTALDFHVIGSLISGSVQKYHQAPVGKIGHIGTGHVVGKARTGIQGSSNNLHQKTFAVPGESAAILNGTGRPPQFVSPNLIHLHSHFIPASSISAYQSRYSVPRSKESVCPAWRFLTIDSTHARTCGSKSTSCIHIIFFIIQKSGSVRSTSACLR